MAEIVECADCHKRVWKKKAFPIVDGLAYICGNCKEEDEREEEVRKREWEKYIGSKRYDKIAGERGLNG